MPDEAAIWVEKAYAERDYFLVSLYHISLPEDLPQSPALKAAFDKPELNEFFELRRKNRKLRELNN